MKQGLKIVTVFCLFFLLTNCTGSDWLDIDFDSCGFYSYVDVASACECFEVTEEYCSSNFYQLDEDEFNRINILFDENEEICIEISGTDFSGKSFSGFAKRPFVDYCHKWFGN
ncbi:hypothetical protein [Flavisericum labens]|uniref:hypothetical protein n=1 Tax=Flavisericum labens TaxID=3377112 RepID=UPI00387B0FB8